MLKIISIFFILFIFMNTASYGNMPEVTVTVKEGYINLPSGKIWYRIAGADKEGIPLVVLHGGPAFPHDYLTSLEALSDERPVIFYDQLGCGNSDRPSDMSLYSVAYFVDELEAVCSALEINKVHILGQGWGNMLAVDYMLEKKPDNVVSLIFASPCLSSSRFIEDQKLYLAELPEDLQKTIKESESAGNFTSPEYQKAMNTYYKLHVCRISPWPDCVNKSFEKIGQPVYEYMWGPSEFTVTGILKDYERAERLKEITVPTLLTCGRYDEVPPSSTEYYQSMMPGSEIAVFEDSSHHHNLEKNDEYIRVVRDFLRRSETGKK